MLKLHTQNYPYLHHFNLNKENNIVINLIKMEIAIYINFTKTKVEIHGSHLELKSG